MGVKGCMSIGYNTVFIYNGVSPHTISNEFGYGIADWKSFVENPELRKTLQGKAFSAYFSQGSDNLTKEFLNLSRDMQNKFVSDFQKSKSFVKFKERPELLNLWKKLRSKNMPEYMYKDVEFLEKLNVSNLNISYIKRTFCDDEMCEYLYKLIKENNFDTKQLQALCGDFEHCVPKDGDGLLELFDFIKTDKNAALQNKAYAFYDKKYKTLRQKAIDYFVEKTPDFVNAFVAELIAYPVADLFKEWYYYNYIDSTKLPDYNKFFLADFNYFESAFRNALQSLNPISVKNSLKQNLINLVPYCITCIEYKNLIDAIHENKQNSKLLLMTIKCLFSVYIDYTLSSRTDNLQGIKKNGVNILLQIIKDVLMNIVDVEAEINETNIELILNKFSNFVKTI